MAKYRTKPKIEEFEAIEYTGDNDTEIIEFAKDSSKLKYFNGELVVMANDHIGWFIRKFEYVVKYPSGDLAVKSWEEIKHHSELVKE